MYVRVACTTIGSEMVTAEILIVYVCLVNGELFFLRAALSLLSLSSGLSNCKLDLIFVVHRVAGIFFCEFECCL